MWLNPGFTICPEFDTICDFFGNSAVDCDWGLNLRISILFVEF